MHNRPASRSFSTAKQVCFAALAFVLFFTLLEGATRIGAFLAFGRSPYFLFYGFKSWMGDSDPQGHSVARDGYFKFPANRVLHQYGMFSEPTPIRINSAGFRGADFESSKPEGVVRIICLGGSSTFGYFDRDPYTYPAILERLFTEKPLPIGRKAEVLNFGVPHATSTNLVALLQGEGLGYEPDFITVYSAFNDAAMVMDMNILQRVARWLHGHVATYVALKRLVSSLGGPELHSRWAKHSTSADYVQRQIELHRDLYERNIRQIVDLSRQVGARVILIKQAYLSGDETLHDLNYAERVATARRRLDQALPVTSSNTGILIHSALMEVLERVALERDLGLVDFIAVVEERPDYLASKVHITEEGNAVLAGLLHSEITRQLESSF